MKKIDRVKKWFVEKSLDVALNGKKGSRIYTKKADGDFEAHLVALSCSDPPEGFARWSFRLLVDKMVELNYFDSVSHGTICRVLKKTKLSLGKGWLIPPGQKRQLCGEHGNGVRPLQTPI